MAVGGEAVWGPPRLCRHHGRQPLSPSSAARRLPPSYSRLLALGPIYYEKPFWLIKKVFQSLRTGSSEIFFSSLLSMGVGASLAPGLSWKEMGLDVEKGVETARGRGVQAWEVPQGFLDARVSTGLIRSDRRSSWAWASDAFLQMVPDSQTSLSGIWCAG